MCNEGQLLNEIDSWVDKYEEAMSYLSSVLSYYDQCEVVDSFCGIHNRNAPCPIDLAKQFIHEWGWTEYDYPIYRS